MLRRCFLLVGLTVVFCLLLGQAAFAQFDDAPAVDSWVYESFRLVYDAGLIKGYPDGTFRGERPATRNEVVEFLARLMNYFEEKLAGAQTGDSDAAAALKKAQADAEAALARAEAALQAAQAAQGAAAGEPGKRYLSEEEVKALIEEELASREAGITQEDLDVLSDDIYEAIQDLEEQFIEELDALDVRVTTLEERVAAIENKDREQDDSIAKLGADMETVKKSLDSLQAQSAQNAAKAEGEAKKAKTLGYVGAALGAIALLLLL